MKKRLLLLIVLLGIVMSGFNTVKAEEAKTVVSEFEFSNFISALEKLPVAERAAYVENNLENVKANNTFPIVSGNNITFVYLGGPKTKIAYVVGDFTFWESDELKMNKIEGTNLFMIKKEFDPASRIEYMFKRKGTSNFDLDALNKNWVPNGVGGKNSIVKMPKYVEAPETKYYEEIEHGTVSQFEIPCKSVVDGRDVQRKVKVYIPAGYDSSKLYKVIYFFDGDGYLSPEYGSAKNILDYMIAKKEIEPTVGVFIDPVERDAEFIQDTRDKFIDYFVNEFVPWIEVKYSVRKDADGRIIAGISNGGFFVTDVLYKHSDKFNCALSGSRVEARHDYGKIEDYNAFLRKMNFPVKLFIATGTYDVFLEDGKNYYEQMKLNPTVKTVVFTTKPDGHNWRFWRDVLREGLLWAKSN